ncbi:MAG: twin-arginine translocation signal domain-containing protein, partial [Candidatus Nanopelagicales bacterium]
MAGLSRRRFLQTASLAAAATGLPLEVDVAWWLHTVDSAEGPL